jgi:glutamyl-tRNA reductase
MMMPDMATRPAQLACLCVPGGRLPLPVFETLSFARDEVADALVELRSACGADQLVILSTCERTELYATWSGAADPRGLARALTANRGVPGSVIDEAATLLTGRDTVHHLLRVTAGLESFVLGESDIVGQVRSAAGIAHSAAVSGLEIDRLLATAVNTSRRIHRDTAMGEGERSVAATAVRRVAAENGGDLRGQRILVVGAGRVAGEIVADAGRRGATVTVCNRTRRRAERFAAAGATVVDLRRLVEMLRMVDVAIFATASPLRLLDRGTAGRSSPEPRR